MKNIKFLSTIIILVTGVIFFACSNNEAQDTIFNDVSNIKNTTIPLDMGGLKFGSIVLPKGTISKISQNGSRLDFKLPKNYIYAATDEKGQVFFADSGSYTCTSNCSGGCDVVKLGDVVGCSACPEGSTDPCTGKRGLNSFQKNNLYSHQIGDGNNGGLINLESGISFITTKKKLNRYVPNLEVLTKHPKIKSEFDNFFNKIWKNKLPTKKNSKEVLVDVYGKTISLLIPIETYQSSKVQFIGGKISCNCSSGSSGCTLKAIKKGFVTVGHTCVAGSCNSCTMSW